MKFPITRSVTIDEARSCGYACGLHGPNTHNCHFSLFATPALTKAWEEGKRRGEEEKAKQRKAKP